MISSATTVTPSRPQPPSIRPAAESTQVRGPRQPKRDAKHDEIVRQAVRIKANGGTLEDVQEFIHQGYGITLPGYKPEVGMGRGLSMAALQGVTFGFGDEAVGSILGLATGIGAQAGRDTYRAELGSFQEDNPKAAFGAEVAGGLLLGGTGAARTTGRAIARQGALSKVASTALLGGAVGGIYAIGSGEGSLEDRSAAIPRGVGGGMLLTPLIGIPAAGIASTVVQPVGRVAVNWVQRLNGRKASTTASRASRETWAEAIVRDQGSIDEAIRFVEKEARGGAPIVAADLGENAGQLTQAASALRGPGRQRLVENLKTRQGDQGDRILSSLFRSMKSGVENAYDAADDLMANRKALADPEFTQAFTETVQVTPEMQRLLNNPVVRQAYEAGRLRAAGDDLATPNSGALPIPPLPEGAVATLPVRALHLIKLGIRDLATSAEGSGATLRQGAARSYYTVANQIRNEVAAQSSSYRKAISIYADETDAVEALQRGKGGKQMVDGVEVTSARFTNKPPEIITRELRAMSANPTQQELYRLGALQDVAELIAEIRGSTPDVAGRLGGRRYGSVVSNMEKRIRALIDDPDRADDVVDYIKAEMLVTETTRRTGGSRTANLQQAMGDLTGDLPTGRGGVIRRTVDAVIEPVMNRAKVGWTDAVSDAVSSDAVKGLRGKDELIAWLNSLRPVVPNRRFQTGATIVGGQQGAQLPGVRLGLEYPTQ